MIILDGGRLGSREEIHAQLKEKLNLPDYYGGNLDALNDCLGERSERELIVIQNAGAFVRECGPYGLKLLEVFADNGIEVLLD